MIWTAGRIIEDDELQVPITDRTFEHGLGLFETLRTWKRKAVLWPRHRDRLMRSAEALGLPVDTATVPTTADLHSLIEGCDHEAESLIRVTTSGGRPGEFPCVVWAAAKPLTGIDPLMVVQLNRAGSVVVTDPLARFKTLNYWRNRIAFEKSRESGGTAEALLCDHRDRVWEASRSNVFIVKDGTIRTPWLAGPVLPGIMRGLALEKARSLGIPTVEEELRIPDLEAADEIFLTNSVRGFMLVYKFRDRFYPSPPIVALRLWDAIETWLNFGEKDK
jgi:branched-subunit amino acid aminotransferase/4-amino-4-deoxychorismate lyase